MSRYLEQQLNYVDYGHWQNKRSRNNFKDVINVKMLRSLQQRVHYVDDDRVILLLLIGGPNVSTLILTRSARKKG